MASVHAFHTTIQFPSMQDYDLLLSLRSFPVLWPDMNALTTPWNKAMCEHPMMHPVIEHALDALAQKESVRTCYVYACTFHKRGENIPATRWINESIEGLISAVHMWLDVASLLSMIERDVPNVSAITHPLLEQVGKEQQRLFTLLAILQGIYFTYCQTHNILPALIATPNEEGDKSEKAEVYV